MARALAQSPTLRPQTLALIRSISPSLLTPSRPKSSRAGKTATVIEIDLGSGSGSESGTEIEVHIGSLNRVEDAIHSIFAQRTAPDWLPFVQGPSYWVPPKSKTTAVAAADFVRLVKTTLLETLTKDEALSLKPSWGWPSSAYFHAGYRSFSDHMHCSITSIRPSPILSSGKLARQIHHNAVYGSRAGEPAVGRARQLKDTFSLSLRHFNL